MKIRFITDAICAATEAVRALAMLQAVEDEAALADIACNAKLREVRFAAVQRVNDPALLERIGEATKHRDDRVYRYTYDLLRARRRDVARVTQAAQLAAGFRGLVELPPESRSLAGGQLRELERALAELRLQGEVPQEVVDLAASAHESVHGAMQALRELGSAAALAEALHGEIDEALRAGPPAAGLKPEVAPFRERLARLSGERPAWLAGHPTVAALASSLERARAKLDEVAPPHAPAAKEKKKEERKDNKPGAPQWQEMRGLLGKLDEHLGAGRLTEALEIEKLIAGRAAAAPLPAGLDRQLKRHLAQLAEMRDWAKWGDDQSREQLIHAADALVVNGKGKEPPDVEALVASVRTLRDEWKRRDETRPASKRQWERFDAILTRAFKPVLEFRARRVAEEKAAAQVRAALYDEFDAWLGSPESSAAPYKEFEARRSDLGRRVRALPFPAPRAERKRLDKLFKAFEARLDALRVTETTRREGLIVKAEALKDTPVGDAIRSAIALQKAWRESGGTHLGRKDEQALWRRFHAATNAVFTRGDEVRAKQNEQTAKRDAERTQRDEKRQAERRAVAQKHETRLARFERLAARSALIEKLEAAASMGGVSDELSTQIAGAWKALPQLATDGAKALQARLAAAPQATAAQLEKGRAEREALLLDLEVALGIPSPESVAAQRRERQLKALQERFKPRNAARAETPEESVVRWYSIAAVANATQAARIGAIVRACYKEAARDRAGLFCFDRRAHNDCEEVSQ